MPTRECAGGAGRPFPILLAAALACVGCRGDAGAAHLARGNVMVNNGKLEEAATEYAEAARLSPRSELARERLGDALYDLGRKDEALAAYRAAAQADPGAATARIGAARVLADKGDLSAARVELTAALAAAPTNLYARLSRGNLAARAGDRKAALEDYATAVHLKSDNLPALSQYGLALLEDGQVDEAERTFDRAVGLAPEAPAGWYGRARVQARRGDKAGAASALAEAQKHILPEARRSLREQGVPAASLEDRAQEQARAARATLGAEPAFAGFAADPAFRAAAGFDPQR
jgi:tetratricopeptide (TPR) repeat protein